jgi:hypothetical protein
LGDIFLSRGIPQNISYFFLHAPVMPLGTPLQPQLYISLDVTHDELRHHPLLLISRYHIRHLPSTQAGIGVRGSPLSPG